MATARLPRLGFRRPRPGLRARATLSFALLGLAVALAVATSAWLLTRAHLVDERESAAERQLYADARLVRAGLRAPSADVTQLLATIQSGTAAEMLVERRGERFSTAVQGLADDIPASLQEVVRTEGAGLQRYRDAHGDLRLALGVSIPSVDARFYESVSLDELEGTLGVLRTSLAVGVAGATAAGALAGHRIAGRLARPLRNIDEAAHRIAGGDLGTRITGDVDPDLRSLVDAFNTMVENLEDRIRRDIRFAADVSHELRSPLAAISAAIEVIERYRDELSPQTAMAFDVLVDRVDTFRRAVDDLLEISRIDAGRAELYLEELDLAAFASAIANARDLGDLTIRVEPGLTVVADRRRLAQAVGNLLDNAVLYAGGPTTLSAARKDGRVRIAVEDAGPGVADEERATIFERFARGRAGTDAGTGSGSGLGLSLVAEHVRLHGGEVRVEDADGGGARFVIELPAEQRR